MTWLYDPLEDGARYGPLARVCERFALAGAVASPRIDPRSGSPSGQGPLPYGDHVVYDWFTSRLSGLAVSASFASFVLVEPHDDLLLAPGYATVVVLRPRVQDIDGFWRAMRACAQDVGVRILVKNVSECVFERGRAMGLCRAYASEEYWSKQAKADDQTYPDVVIDLQGRFRRHDPLQETVVFEHTEAGIALQATQGLVDAWVPWFCARHPECDMQDVRAFYASALSDRISTSIDFAFIGVSGKRLVATGIGSKITSEQVDLWVVLTTREPRRISRAFYAWMFDFFRGAGFRFVGLGGSEASGLHWFKCSLGTHVLFNRYHAIVDTGDE